MPRGVHLTKSQQSEIANDEAHPDDVATRHNVSAKTVRKLRMWLRQGKIQIVKVGNKQG